MENKLCDSFEAAQAVAGVHGGGSPLMETICMMSRYPLEDLKAIAKYLAGIPGYEKCPRFERSYQSPRAMLAKFDASVAPSRSNYLINDLPRSASGPDHPELFYDLTRVMLMPG